MIRLDTEPGTRVVIRPGYTSWTPTGKPQPATVIRIEPEYRFWPTQYNDPNPPAVIVKFDDSEFQYCYQLSEADYPLTVAEPSWQGNRHCGTLTTRHGKHPQSQWCLRFATERNTKHQPRTASTEYWNAVMEYRQTLRDLVSAGF